MAVCDLERPRRAGKTVKQAGAPPACSHSGWFRASRSDHSPHMVVMEVIVRHQDRGALRLDHLHNRHYAGRRRSDLTFDHRHNAE